jgi:hypothetical protein
MKPFPDIYLPLFICLLMGFLGCDCSKNKNLVAELEKARSKIDRLESDIRELERKYEYLAFEHKRILAKQKALKLWSKKIVEGYGPGIWYMDESTHPVFVKSIESKDIQKILIEMNSRFKQDGLPQILFQKVDGNIAYVRVDNEALLTQRMGTHGAISYLNAVTYTIASIDGIECVWFDFAGGDHAVPGKYCR